MRFLRPVAAVVFSVLGVIAACADDEPSGASPTPTAPTTTTPVPTGSTSATTTPTTPPPPVPVVDSRGMPPDLTCPGDAGCGQASGALRVGVAARTITPTVMETYTDLNGNGNFDAKSEPFDDKNGNGKIDAAWLAGFGTGRAATKAHDDTWARVLTFSQGDVSVALVSLDLIGLFHNHVLEIRQAARDKGLDFDHIMVSTTHVHESKDTMGMWGAAPLEPGIDPAYMTYIRDRVIEALVEAKQGERAARTRLARAEAPHLVNDTRLPKVVEQGIHSMQFVDEADRPFATLVNWGNHPEALGSKNLELTSDYPHYLRAALETRYPGSTAVFFNGCLGGLTTTIGVVGCPDADGKETCPQGTFERAEYIGRGAGEAAIASLDAATDLDAAPSLAVRRRSLLVSATNSGLALLVSLGVLPRPIHASDGQLLPPDVQASITAKELLDPATGYRVASEVNAIEIGSLVIATVPGELYTELWMPRADGGSYVETPEGADYKDAKVLPPLAGMLPKGRTHIVINNANDALGYIIPRPQWDKSSPYAYGKTTSPQYGEENSIGHAMSETLYDGFLRLYPAAP